MAQPFDTSNFNIYKPITISLPLYMSYISWLVLILQVSLSLIGPYMFLKIVLSQVASIEVALSDMVQDSLSYTTTGLIIVLYILILTFLDMKIIQTTP